MARDRFTETRKSKRLGEMLFVYLHTGVGGVVPNHAPHTRKVMISRSKHGWHLHLTLKVLRTWDGLRDFDISIALHPSRKRRERLQAKATRT